MTPLGRARWSCGFARTGEEELCRGGMRGEVFSSLGALGFEIAEATTHYAIGNEGVRLPSSSQRVGRPQISQCSGAHVPLLEDVLWSPDAQRGCVQEKRQV